ncbi:hypothetical protein [Bordetella trematum]|uniref:hypothetical protein n=1 Tax=Bordetella trematum TaxID=123899 RepID=UPI000471BC8B|nr:hypothetical protein [Bordetella trematum]
MKQQIISLLERAKENGATIGDVLAEVRGLAADPAPNAEPVAWRYQTPTGWHATTDAQKAVRLRAHHPVEPTYAAPPAADERDAAFEAVRREICKLPRYSFLLNQSGGVQRINDRCGNWVEFGAVHQLFDPVEVDAAIAAQQGEGGGV